MLQIKFSSLFCNRIPLESVVHHMNAYACVTFMPLEFPLPFSAFCKKFYISSIWPFFPFLLYNIVLILFALFFCGANN